LPANQAARFSRHTASSFIASKLGSNRNRRTRWSEACPRIRRRGLPGIPRHRSSRASPAPTEIVEPVGARLARESGGAVLQAYRAIVHREQARLQQKSSNPLERGLPANQAARYSRHTASSFIASKPGSHRNRRTRWSEACPRIRRRGLAGIPRHRSSRASPAPTEIVEPVGARLAREPGGAV